MEEIRKLTSKVEQIPSLFFLTLLLSNCTYDIREVVVCVSEKKGSVMPVSSAGHLPHITSTSYPALVSYLASNYNAQRISNWSITIRTLRSSYENSKESGAGGGSPSRPKVMYIVSLSEFPADTFILIEDGEKDTRARVKARILEHRQQQDILMNQGNMEMAPLPLTSISQLQTSLQKSSTRYTLFASSIYYPLLLSRLNLPAPLGAPSMGDGGVSSSSGQGGGGPGAWLPRGKHIVIEGATYDLPSATRYGVEESIDGNNCEWRVRLGMIQSGGSRSSGAIMEVS